MMVEQSRYVQNVTSLQNDLVKATTQLKEVSGNKMISSQEIKALTTTLQNVNTNLDPTFWSDKNPAPTKMQGTIENALAALALFPKAPPKNAEQAIVSLFSSLTSTLRDFGKNLRDLKKYKIGQKVEKVDEAKPSKKEGG